LLQIDGYAKIIRTRETGPQDSNSLTCAYAEAASRTFGGRMENLRVAADLKQLTS